MAKQFKKSLVIFLVSMLVLSSLAAISVSAGSAVRVNDFSNVELNKATSFSSTDWPNTTADTMPYTSEALVYDGVNGKFGRDNTDRSLYFWNDPEVALPDAQRFQQLRLKTKDAETDINSGEYQELSFSLAYDGKGSTKHIDILFKTDNYAAATKSKITPFFRMNPDGSLTVFNKTIEKLFLQSKKWYKVRIVFKSGDNTAADAADRNRYKLYLDDKLIDDAVFEPFVTNDTTSKTFKGLSVIWVGQYIFETVSNGGEIKNTSQKYLKKELYLDDLTLTSSTIEPVYTPLTLSHNNPHINKYISQTNGMKIYTEYDTVVSELNSGFSGGDEAITVTAKDCSGFSCQDDTVLIKDNTYLKIQREDDSILYASFLTDYKVAYEQGFSAAADDAVPAKWTTTKRAGLTKTHYPYGTSGREASDYSFSLITKGTASTDSTPFMKMMRNEFTSEFELPIHIDMSLLMNSSVGEAPVTFDFYYGVSENTATEIQQTAFTFHEDGRITDRAGTTVASFGENEWTRTVVSIYPDSQMLEVRVDGKSASLLNINNDDMNRLLYFRIIQTFLGSANPYDAYFAVDDVKIYTGAYPVLTTEDVLSLSASDNMGYEVKDAYIYLPKSEISYSDFQGNITGYTDYILFSDNSMTSTVESETTVTDGNVLLLSDGYIYKYYKIITPVNYTIGGAEVPFGYFKYGELSLTAKVENYSSNNTITMLIAQYDNTGKLINLAVEDKQIYGGSVTDTITITETTGTKLKVILLGNTDAMKPLRKATELLPINE